VDRSLTYRRHLESLRKKLTSRVALLRRLAGRAMEPGHLLHSALTRPPGANPRRLTRYPFVPAAQQLIGSSDNNNIRAAQWADHQWKAVWLDNLTRLRTFIPDIGTHPPGMTLPRTPVSRLTASAPVSDVPLLLAQMGYGPLCVL